MSLTPPIQYDLKTGFPDLNLIPRGQLSEIMMDLLQRDAPVQYAADSVGEPYAEEQIAAWLSGQTGQSVTRNNLQLTTGAIPTIDQTCRYLTKPGDIVLVEDPTFYYIISKFELYHVDVMGIPMQPDGVDLDALEALCQQHGDRISMFYAIPSYHNPTGYCYSEEKRRALVELAERYDFTVVEDTTYQLLHYGDQPPPPMIRTLAPESDHVIAVGSFSKLVMPALRFGWLWATPAQIDGLLRAKTAVMSAFSAHVIAEMIASNTLDDQITHARTLYGDKYRLAMQALDDHAPDGFQYVRPEGGYFIWGALPEGVRAGDVLATAQQHGIDFMQGKLAFADENAPDRTLRLCFAMQPDDIVRDGITALCEVLREVVPSA